MPARARKTNKPARSTRAPQPQRPHMPGYGLPEHAKGLLPWSWAERRLVRSHNYWLITSRPGGAPHCMPVWGIWHAGAFYFSTGGRSRKARNLAQDARCIVCNERAEEAVIVEGVAKRVKDPKRIARLSRPYAKKYEGFSLDPELGPVFEVRPSVVFGMWEKKFVQSATRWRFRASKRA